MNIKCGTGKTDEQNGISEEVRDKMNRDKIEARRKVNAPFQKELQDLETEVFNRSGKASQITIDIIQNSIHDLDEENKVINRDDLGSIQYHIGKLLDVIKESLEFDICILKKMYDILQRWKEVLPKM